MWREFRSEHLRTTVIQYKEMNPEVLQQFKVGIAINMESQEIFIKQLEEFVNDFQNNIKTYNKALADANNAYSQKKLIINLLGR